MAASEVEPRKLHPTVLDTGEVQLARVYAEALYAAAEKAGQLTALLEEFGSLVDDVLQTMPQFRNLLESAVVARKARAETLRRVFESRASQLLLRFLEVLNERGRLALLPTIWAELQQVHRQKLGLVAVEVRTALPLGTAETEAIRTHIAEVSGRSPELHLVVEPELLGGIVVRVGDSVFDGSVRTKLTRLREQLMKRSKHEIQSRRDQLHHSE